MKVLRRGKKLFIRHWFRWWVMDTAVPPFIAVDEMMPIFRKQVPNETKG